jgi:hypothetical protein
MMRICAALRNPELQPRGQYGTRSRGRFAEL